jgi:hypothetical protein
MPSRSRRAMLIDQEAPNGHGPAGDAAALSLTSTIDEKENDDGSFSTHGPAGPD